MQLPPEMYHKYITRRAADYDQLMEALGKTDLTCFKKVGHQIKGNATTFGFEELVGLALRMENIDENTIAVEGPAILSELKNWIATRSKEYGVS